MAQAPFTRGELMAGYERPYRRWLPVAWEYEHVPRAVAIGGLLSLAGLIADRVDPPHTTLLLSGLAIGVGVLLWAAWVTVSAAFIVGGRIRDWEESEHELAAVRRRRPHAAEIDHELAHSEYAVSVDEAGQLVTWRFKPLAANETAPGHALLITGRPRYAAVAVDEEPYDPVDAARAAEQLAEAQQRAARLEVAAVERARQGLEEAETAAVLEQESRSTAAALRGITGQSDA
jgi:hypothetical protein